MGELRRFIKSNNLIMRAVSLILTVAILASAFVYLGNEKMDNVSAADVDSSKTYMEYIVKRLIDGAQEEFNILEIVPYEGQGEFRYYASDSEVTEALEADQAKLEQIYRDLGNSRGDAGWTNADEWQAMPAPYSDYSYQIRFSNEIMRFEVQGPSTFVSSVVSEYKDLVSEALKVNTVEANKLTEADIKNADLIVINTGSSKDNTNKLLAMYNAYTGNTSTDPVVFDKEGNPITDGDKFTFGSFEKVDESTLPEEPDVPDDPDNPDEPGVTTGKIYFMNESNWGNVYAYYWSAANRDMIAWPGKQMTLVEGEEKIYSLEITSDVEFVIFNNGGSTEKDTMNIAGFDKIYYGGEWLDYPLPEEPSTEELESTEPESGEETTVEGETETETETEAETETEPEPVEPPAPSDGYAYISRDMSWNMCQKLLDYTINGKNVDLPDGTSITEVKTPVIINNYGTESLPKDSNIYKLMLIYRTCNSDRWNTLKNYISTKDAAGVKYRNAAGTVTAAMDVTGTGFTADSLVSWETGENNSVKALFTAIAPDGKNPEGVAYTPYKENNPSINDNITNDYWVYKAEKAFIPANYDSREIKADTANFSGRVDNISGNKAKVGDVLEYLLGAKSSQIYSFTDKVRVLEIQPWNSFEYNTLEKIKELGVKLMRKDAELWTDGGEYDYRQYISVECVTPNALNGMTVDIASEYDVIIMGDNSDIHVEGNYVDASGNTKYGPIYNDRGLDGYVYLAFGDLMKLNTYALGYLEEDYIQLSASDAEKYENGNSQYIPDITLRKISEERMWTPNMYNKLMAKYNSSSGMSEYFILKDLYAYYAKHSWVGGVEKNNENYFMTQSLGNARFSDNDITDITKEKLISFVKTGNPIIVEDCIYYADNTKIYPTSDMYDFVKNVLGKVNTSTGKRVYTNVLKTSEVGRAVAYLGTKAPSIKFQTGKVDVYTKAADGAYVKNTSLSNQTRELKPVEPQYTGGDAYGNGGVVYTFGTRDLHYKFNITGQVGKKYRVKLYIDKNNDGVFKGEEVGVSDDSNELYYSEELVLNSRTVGYYIDTKVSDNFVGLLAWKLEVVQLDDAGQPTSFRVSEKGYSAIVPNSTPKEISVLQIQPGDNNLDLTSDAFMNLFNPVQDATGYEVTMNIMSVETFVGKYDSETDRYIKGDPDYGYGSDRDQLKTYDMIVLGFSDSFNKNDINNDWGALDNILDFIDAGKAVMFTHDTLSWRSTLNYTAGYQESSGELASNPYGATNRMLSKFYTANSTGGYNSGEYKYENPAPNLSFNLRNRVGLDKYGVTLTEAERIAQGKEIPKYASLAENGIEARRPSYMSAGDYNVREIQGFTSWNSQKMVLSFRLSNTRLDSTYYNLTQFDDLGIFNGDHTGNGAALLTTVQVVNLNEGAVTMYPYRIPNELTVNLTHSQYYELDMEDEEVVVWYTLDDTERVPDSMRDGNYVKGSSDSINSVQNTSDYYKYTYKDASSNYYIYSKGNITYSGAGHSKMVNSETEFKLFVNTIIKAIAGGNNEPIVEVTNGGIGAGGQCIVYVSSTDTPDSYQIDFRATDADLLTYENTNGNIDLVGEFRKAEIYWKYDGTEKLIKSTGYTAVGRGGATHTGALKNGIIQEIKLSETNLTAEELLIIENEIRSGRGARFRIIVDDYADREGALLPESERGTSVEIVIHFREMFEMN